MSNSRTPTKVSWGLLVSLLLVVAFRLPYIARPFNDEDVAQIAYSASRAAEGQLLYRDTADNKPPLALTVFAVTFRLFGREMTAVNALALLWALAATLLVFLLTDALFGRTAATGAALFYAVFANSDTVNGTSPSYDFWMLPFMVAAVYCFIRGFGVLGSGFWGQKPRTQNPEPRTPNSGVWLFAAGVCSGLAVTSKQQALFNFVALLNYVVFLACWDRAQRKQLTGTVAWLLLGFAVAWLPFFFYFWSRGGMADFMDSVSPKHNVSYMGSRTGTTVVSAAQVQFIRQISRDTILWVFALVGLGHLLIGKKGSMGQFQIPNPKSQIPNPKSAMLLWLWAFWSLVGVSITKRFYDHYFQQMIPVFSVLAGYVCGLCFQGRRPQGARLRLGSTAPSPSRLRQMLLRQAPRWALVAAIGLGFLWSGRQSFRAREMLRRTAHRLTGRPSRDGNGAKKVGEYIRAHSTPDDRLYVWGWKPEIYYFADRKAPTKWWEANLGVGMWQRVAPEFERYKPKFIVVMDNSSLGETPGFTDFMRRHYEPAIQMAEFQILRLRPSRG